MRHTVPLTTHVWCLICMVSLCAADSRVQPDPYNYPTNEAAVETFGVEKSEPLDGHGFLFFDGKWIEPPYVVERRGLDVLVNGICIYPGVAWPALDLRVKEDPGLPPADLPPWGPWPKYVENFYEFYWSRKARYLMGQTEAEEFPEAMRQAYLASPLVESVTYVPDEYTYEMKSKAGTTHRYRLMHMPPPPPLESVPYQQAERRYRQLLGVARAQGPMVYMRTSYGAGLHDATPGVIDFLKVLAAEATPEDRLKLLSEFSGREERPFGSINTWIMNFEPNDRFRQRVLATEAALLQRQTDAEAATTARIRADLERRYAERQAAAEVKRNEILASPPPVAEFLTEASMPEPNSFNWVLYLLLAAALFLLILGWIFFSNARKRRSD